MEKYRHRGWKIFKGEWTNFAYIFRNYEAQILQAYSFSLHQISLQTVFYDLHKRAALKSLLPTVPRNKSLVIAFLQSLLPIPTFYSISQSGKKCLFSSGKVLQTLWPCLKCSTSMINIKIPITELLEYSLILFKC